MASFELSICAKEPKEMKKKAGIGIKKNKAAVMSFRIVSTNNFGQSLIHRARFLSYFVIFQSYREIHQLLQRQKNLTVVHNSSARENE